MAEVLAHCCAVSAKGGHVFVDFAQQLLQHARTEEEVTYPAAVLVGPMVRQRPGRRVAATA